TVARGDIAKGLRVELPRERRHSELLHSIGDDLSTRIVHPQCRVVILIDEDLERLQQSKDRLLANLARPANTILLRAHIQHRPAWRRSGGSDGRTDNAGSSG